MLQNLTCHLSLITLVSPGFLSYDQAMPNLPVNPVILASAILVITVLLLYLREYNRRKKLESAGDKFLQDIKAKGWETLNESIKQSQTIVEQAELEGIKLVAGNKFQTQKIDADYARELSVVLEQSKKEINLAQAQLLQFMRDLQIRSSQFEEASQMAGQQRINQLFERVENRLSDFLIQTEQKTTSSIELELKAVRQLIETYKEEQFKLIDENIIAMMEQTLNIVLNKKLSLGDQLDLVYEALEKAKAEKFIV